MTTLIVPMAGKGQRFVDEGYIFPKPLIEVNGKLMVEYVLENFENISDLKYLFIVLKEHNDEFAIAEVMKRLVPNAQVKILDEVTQGAAQTVLSVRDMIDPEEDIIISNCDQWLEWDSNDFIKQARENPYHWVITFTSVHPKFSYVKFNGERVTEVKEKTPISDIATVGIYYWKHWKDFVWAADDMIAKDIRTRGEFYVCPVYQQAVDRGDIIKIYPTVMHCLGTPEDLRAFGEYLKKKELGVE